MAATLTEEPENANTNLNATSMASACHARLSACCYRLRLTV